MADFNSLLSDCGAGDDAGAAGPNRLYTAVRRFLKTKLYRPETVEGWQSSADHIGALIGAVQSFQKGEGTLRLAALRDVDYVGDVNLDAVLEAWRVAKDPAFSKAVKTYWPIIDRALQKEGIGSPAVKIVAMATVYKESSFNPRAENRDSDGLDGAQGGRYRARGFLQLFGRGNYETYGAALKINLLDTPELALDPEIGALILARYFKARGVATAAEAGNYPAARRAVLGSTADFESFKAFLQPLLNNRAKIFSPGR